MHKRYLKILNLFHMKLANLVLHRGLGFFIKNPQRSFYGY